MICASVNKISGNFRQKDTQGSNPKSFVSRRNLDKNALNTKVMQIQTYQRCERNKFVNVI